MALRYAVASGNWSNTATWDGGTLPTTADDVYANNFNIALDQNVNILSLRNTAGAPAVAGGFFTITANRTVTLTGLGVIPGAAAGGVIQINAPSLAVTITGPINGGNVANYIGVTIGALCNGSVLSIVGVCTSGTSVSGYAVNALVGNIVINLTGNVMAGAAVAIRCSVASSTINITGNATGGTTAGAAGASVVGTSAINVVGNCTASAGPALLTAGTTSPITVSGVITAGNYHAIDSASTVTVSSTLINSNNFTAVYAPNIKLLGASNITWTFKDESNVNKALYSAGVALGNPVTSDVRNGTTYGASLELTGTLAVPDPATVALGVPTDNTTGTYATTPALIAAQVRVELATELARIDVNTSSRLAGASYTAPANSDIAAIKAKTDNLPASPANENTLAEVKANTDLIPVLL